MARKSLVVSILAQVEFLIDQKVAMGLNFRRQFTFLFLALFVVNQKLTSVVVANDRVKVPGPVVVWHNTVLQN